MRGSGKVLVVISLMGLWMQPAAAEAQLLPCTFDWEPKNDGHQIGTGLWLKYTVETILKLPPCQIGAFVEAKVDGVSGSSLRRDGVTTASAVRDIPVPWSDTWNISGEHSRGSVFGEVYLGHTDKPVAVNATEDDPPADDPPADDEPQETTGGNDPDSACPLVIDTKGNGVKLTTAEDGVVFDIDGDGQAEQVGWTRADSDDVWLAMDRNGNGRIDDGTELFGNNTPVRTGQTTSNGFEALNFLHSESVGLAALDSAIAASDTAWGRLLLWRDANHNGVSETDELSRVVDSPLTSIDLRYEIVSKVRKDNEVKEVSSVVWGGATRQIVDVWLAIR